MLHICKVIKKVFPIAAPKTENLFSLDVVKKFIKLKFTSQVRS